MMSGKNGLEKKYNGGKEDGSLEFKIAKKQTAVYIGEWDSFEGSFQAFRVQKLENVTYLYRSEWYFSWTSFNQQNAGNLCVHI